MKFGGLTGGPAALITKQGPKARQYGNLGLHSRSVSGKSRCPIAGGAPKFLWALFLGFFLGLPFSHSLAKSDYAVEDFKELPLIVTSADSVSGDRLGVFITGDGGWGVTDQGLCKGLASNGIPMVALNSLKYFWKKRTPDSAAADLDRILRYYLPFWKKEKIILVGYSMGADVLPFMVSRLPRDLSDRIALIALLGPSVTVEFEFHVSNWFISGSSSKGLPVMPELEKLRGKTMLAFYGAEEEDSLCKIMDPKLARIIPLKGGHRIRGNYGPVLNEILEALK